MSKLKQQVAHEERLMEMKDRLRILLETPLFINSDLLDNDLLWSIDDNNGSEEIRSKVIQLIKKQTGIYSLLQSTLDK